MRAELPQAIRRALENVDRLTLRERLFLLAALLVVLGGLWEALLDRPLEARQHLAQQRIAGAQQQLGELGRTVTAMAAGMDTGLPGERRRLRALRQRVADTEDSLLNTHGLVDPAQMRFVLEDLLEKGSGLKLVSLVNLDVKPLLEAAKQSGETETKPGGHAEELYQHTFVLTLEGSYLDCLHYLQAVEQLPWQLYWSRLDLEQESYPLNKIVIRINTLSLDKEWIGV
ncbi:MAG TPA: hypothetical protein VFY39_17605 [Gammaproteobacteria bacterium]|nr:hypothetical protein [Gammaproteobacteria bacterium]